MSSAFCQYIFVKFRCVRPNAIKFTPKGGKVEVKLDVVNSWATIAVSNTGIGMSAEFLPRVFDRFTQEEVPSRHSPGGLVVCLINSDGCKIPDFFKKSGI